MNPFQNTADLVAVIEKVLPALAAKALALEPERTGGYLSIRSVEKGGLITSQIVAGNPAAEKQSRWKGLSQEKAERLGAYPAHSFSSQSRDIDSGKYGGAVRADCDLIFSFSGFSEALDEAFVLAVLQQAGFMNAAGSQALLAKSGLDQDVAGRHLADLLR